MALIMPRRTTTPLRSWDWLGSGRAYERVRRALVVFFAGNGCGMRAEELTDEVFDRVDKKLINDSEFVSRYEGEPARFFHGVARNVLKEAWRQPQAMRLPDPPEMDEFSEQRSQCLDQCMDKMAPHFRTLILEYYKGEGAEKIRIRQEMAKRQGIAMNALRIRMFRARESLADCVKSCLRRKGHLDPVSN